LQEYAWTQTPPRQFVEQHSAPAAQALPSVVQVPTDVVTTAQAPPVHVPEQHCVPVEQGAPTDAHASVAHWPETQEREQHSVGEVQASLALLQNVDEVHLPEAHTVEQHWPSAAQVSPPTPQAGAGGAVHLRSPPHSPEQHWPRPAAVHVAPWARHCPAGSTQTPPAHEFVQQFASEPQACPTALQVAGATQAPLQARLQHSDGTAQAVPSALHAGAGPQAPPALHWPEQHSAAPVQSAPSLLHVSAAPHRPLGHEPEQHSDAATHAAPSGWHAPPPSER
jgi:hypothetical protein